MIMGAREWITQHLVNGVLPWLKVLMEQAPPSRRLRRQHLLHIVSGSSTSDARSVAAVGDAPRLANSLGALCKAFMSEVEVEALVIQGPKSVSPLSSPSASSDGGNVSDSENEGEEKLEEEKQQSWYSSVLWNQFFVFGVLMFIFFCVSCRSYPSFKGSENSADKFQKIKAADPLGLGIFMNLSQMCPIVRESSCNLIYLEMDGMLGREKLEEGESWDEGNGSGLYDKTEVLKVGVQDLLVQNGGLADDDSVVEEKMERDGQDKWYPWPLAELASSNKSVIAVETMKGTSIACTSDESSLA